MLIFRVQINKDVTKIHPKNTSLYKTYNKYKKDKQSRRAKYYILASARHDALISHNNIKVFLFILF